jgi:UDP-N-acetylmuramyl tripeptide synthase
MWKFYLSLFLAKLTNLVIKLFNFGHGMTWPGHVALKLYPEILKDGKFKFPYGVILVSGTNGKTTTTKILTHILEYSGLKVVHNKSGANLLNGIVSSLLLSMDFLGHLNSDIAVFEVDENTLPQILQFIDPNVLVLLNLSRDQLDRYGEVDVILEKWMAAVSNLHSDTELVLDSSQNYFNPLIEVFKGEVTNFDDSDEYSKLTNLVGKFNIKNINAAVDTAILVGIEEDLIKESLADFTSAYGRGEVVEYADKEFHIFLAKNPASFNNNVEEIVSGNVSGDAYWIIFNDNIPDGRDVSWIYDINPVLLEKSFVGKKVFISGSRYLDMAVRFKYAEIEVLEENISSNYSQILNKIASDPEIEEIVVFPNYSAMLDIRKLLTGNRIL